MTTLPPIEIPPQAPTFAYMETLGSDTTQTTLPAIYPLNRVKINPYDCSCVQFVRDKGLDFPRINTPDDLEPSSNPVLGGGVLFKYPNGYSHIGYIQDIRGAGFVMSDRRILKDSEGNEYCSDDMRFMFWDDPALRGFVSSSLTTNSPI